MRHGGEKAVFINAQGQEAKPIARNLEMKERRVGVEHKADSKLYHL
jgi:hypothetical protein